MESSKISPQKGIAKEYLLLFLGALISLVSTVSISLMNRRFDDTDELTKSKIAFADELSKSLAKRFNVLGNLYNAKLDNNKSGIEKWNKVNDDLDTAMFTRTYYYPSRLRVLFNKERADEFHLSIDTVMDNIEGYIVNVKADSIHHKDISVQWGQLDSRMHKYIRSLYEDAFADYKH